MALEVGHAGRESAEIRLLRRGLETLDKVKPGETATDVEWLRTRIRLLVTLAYCEAELGTLADGLAILDEVRPQIEQLSDGLVRAELSSAVDANHASLLIRAGQYEESLPLLDSNIKNKERSLASGTGDPKWLAESLIASVANMGQAYVELGRLGPATRNLNRAIALAVEHELPMRAAYVRHILGDLKLRAGDVPEALEHYEETERVYLALGPDMLPRLRLDQAQALLAGGLADEAGKHLDEVLPHMRKQRVQQDLAEAELFRAVAALLERDLEKARGMAASARRRFLRRGSDNWATVAALIGLRIDTARALAARKIRKPLPVKAIELANQLSGIRLADEAALARLLAVRLELHRGHLDNASTLLREVPRPGRLTPIDHRMLLRLCRAELAMAEGNRRKALAQARAGLTELGRARDRMGGLELVSGTALHGQALGDLAVRLVLDERRSNARRLFDWLERTKAQTYRYEQLTDIGENPQLTELIAEIRHLSHTLRQARLEGRQTRQMRDRFAERQREAMRLGWHASRWGKPRPVAGIPEVFEQLGDRILINFAVSGDSLVAVVLVDGRVRMVRLGSSAKAAETALRLHIDLNALAPDHGPALMAEAITRSAQRHAELLDSQLIHPILGERADRDVTARHRAEQLDSQLVHPILDALGDREAVIVPTGALYAVPWGVLGSLRSRPIVVAPSATSWLAASQFESDLESPRTGSVLVRGPELPEAVGEINNLAAHHRDAVVLVDEQATVSNVLSALDGARLAHIAAHGSHEPENALFSRLDLVDGALSAYETARLKRPPTQVVLAACELALNRIRPGDEALGFAGALLASGAKTVVAATSKVGDIASAATMDDYHRRLAAGAAPAVALAEAVSADPFRRPFICLGSGTQVLGTD